jgi:signal transduction histidine kinase
MIPAMFPWKAAGTAERLATTVAAGSAAAAGAVAVGLVAAGLITDDAVLIKRSVVPVVFAGFVVMLLYLRRATLFPVLVAGLVAIVVQSLVVDRATIEPTTINALFGTGVLGVFIFRKPVRWYVIAYAVGLGATTVLLRFPESGAAAVIDGVTSAAIFGVIGTTLLLTRRTLEKERHRFQTLFEGSPVATFELDLSGVASFSRQKLLSLDDEPTGAGETLDLISVVNANPAAVRLLETDDVRDITGTGQSMFVSGDAVQTAHAIVAAYLDGSSRIRLPLTSKTHRGNRLNALLDVVLPAPEGGVRGLDRAILTMTDVTALIEAEERLRASLRSKDEFVATISEELRGPLVAATALIEELKDRAYELTHDETFRLAEAANTQATRAESIVRDLLVAAQANLDGLEIRLESIPIEELLADAPQDSRTWVEVRVPGAMVVFDRARAHQIIGNLLDNARRHGGDHLRILAGVDGSYGWIEVRDDGDPIPETLREVIFEPFGSEAGVDGGPVLSIGVGLTISRRLARLMDGDLTYRHNGNESVFRLAMPLSAGQRDG